MKGVIGIDEVGRGPLAGPVTVCALYLADPKKAKKDYFESRIRDSKRLSLVSRIKIFETIRKNRATDTIIYTLSSRSAGHVDRHGINKSIHSCMVSCLKQMEKKGVTISELQINLDGGLVIKDNRLKQRTYIKGDETFIEIALASVMAKVSRDKYMKRIAKLTPGYGFDTNVGYGTKEHISAIKKIGVTKYHRNTYLQTILTIR